MNEWTKPAHAEAYLARKDRIPHRSAGEMTLLAELPARVDRVLDLGCGDGHLLSLVLDAHPQAVGVGLDFSTTMLARAQARFAGNENVTLVEHNLDFPLPELGTFDCVVSSFAIHHCEHDRKRQIYGEVVGRLRPGGVFANLEHVASVCSAAHLRFLAELDITPEEEDPSNKLLDLATQLAWFCELGLVEVDCYWKWRELALMVGWRPGSTGAGV